MKLILNGEFVPNGTIVTKPQGVKKHKLIKTGVKFYKYDVPSPTSTMYANKIVLQALENTSGYPYFVVLPRDGKVGIDFPDIESLQVFLNKIKKPSKHNKQGLLFFTSDI